MPLIDTYISKHHYYNINNKWTKPYLEKLKQEWNNTSIYYYNFELEDYHNDHLIVNGLKMESWDGKDPYESRDYKWLRNNNEFKKINLI